MVSTQKRILRYVTIEVETGLYGDRFPVFFTWKMLGATLNETDNFTNSPTLKIAIMFQGRKRL